MILQISQVSVNFVIYFLGRKVDGMPEIFPAINNVE